MIPVFLAPLAGMTDAAMRFVCAKYGADKAYTEMVSVNGIKYGNKKTKELLFLNPDERIGVQLFGSDADTVADTARAVYDFLGGSLREININMGCPAPKIVNNGEGAALMLDIKRAAAIIEKTVRAANVPVSVKFRSGFDAAHINAAEFAKMAQESGAAFVCVHGRTREQYYGGKADRSVIRRVKEAVSIPVIGNGDIWCGRDAAEMLRETGCDGVMAARGALGNPFIFTHIREYLEYGEEKTVISPELRIETCLEQAKKAVEIKGEHMGILQMRKHAAFYLKGLKNSAQTRANVVRAETLSQLEEILSGYIESEIKKG